METKELKKISPSVLKDKTTTLVSQLRCGIYRNSIS